MSIFVVVLLVLWCCSIAAKIVGPAEEGCECLDYDNLQDSHCDANVFPGWAQEYEITAAGTLAELTCYAQHPCLSQDVIIVWHVTTEGETEEDVGGGSYRTNSDLGQLHLQQGLSISAHCLNFYCHSMLLIPAVAVNNHTQVWCGAYTKVCPGNEQNPTPPITIIVEGSLPGPPHDVTVMELNSTHLQLSWLPPPPPHIPSLTQYSVHVSDFTGDVTDYDTTRSVLIVPIPEGSVKFHVGACNVAGEGEAASIAYERETLQDIIVGEAAGALCFRCDFTADSQAQGCQVDVRNKKNGEVEQSFRLSRKSLLMTCARGLRMANKEYMVIAREIEVSGRIGTEVVRHWDPLLLPPSPPSLSPSSTTEAALTNESSSENLSPSEDPVPSEHSENTLHSELPSPSGEPSLTDENGGNPPGPTLEELPPSDKQSGEEGAPTSVVLPSATKTFRDEATEEPSLRNRGEAATYPPMPTEEQALRDDGGEGWLDVTLPSSPPTSAIEEQSLRIKDEDKKERPLKTIFHAPPTNVEDKEEPANGDEGCAKEEEVAAPSIPHQSLKEAVVSDEAQGEEEGTEDLAVRTEDEGRVEDSLPLKFPTSEEHKGGSKDKDEEEMTENTVFRKYEVGEEETLSTVFPTLEEPLVRDGDQEEEEGAEKQVKVEDALPSGSPTLEEPRVGGEDKDEEEGAELMVGGRDRDEEQGTEQPVYRKDDVGEEGALPIISDEPMVGVEDRNAEQGAEEPVSRKDEFGWEGALPTVSPTSEVVRDGDQEEEEGAEKQVKVEDALPSVSPTLKEPRVGDEDKDEEEGAELMDGERGRDEERGTEEPVYRRGEVGEDGALPIISVTLDEPMVGVEDRDEEQGAEEPVSRKEFGEESALPTVSPTSEVDHMVRDGDQEEEEGAEKQVKVDNTLPSVSPTLEEPRIGGEDKDEEEGAELMVGDKDENVEQGTEEPVFRIDDEVVEEGALPVVSLTSDELMVGVQEEKDKVQGTEESVSRKDKFGEEGAQPIVSLTSEEPVVGDGDQEQEESKETVFRKEDEIRMEYALPTVSQASEEPMVGNEVKDGEKELIFGDKDELDRDEEKGAEELIVRGKSFQPISSPSSKGLTTGGEDKDKKEDPDVGKPMIEDEDGQQEGTLSSSSEEPMVESKTKGVLPTPSLSLQEPTVREMDGEQRESMLPISPPSLEEHTVRDEDEKQSVAALPIQLPISEEPVVRYNGYEEEDAPPIVSPLLEEHVEDEEEEERKDFLPIPPLTPEDKSKVEQRKKGNPPATTYAGPYDQLERPTALLLIVGVVLLGVLVAVAVARRRKNAHSPEDPSSSSLYPPTEYEPNPTVITPHQQEQVHMLEISELTPANREIPPPQLTYYRDFRKKFRYKISD